MGRRFSSAGSPDGNPVSGLISIGIISVGVGDGDVGEGKGVSVGMRRISLGVEKGVGAAPEYIRSDAEFSCGWKGVGDESPMAETSPAGLVQPVSMTAKQIT